MRIGFDTRSTGFSCYRFELKKKKIVVNRYEVPVLKSDDCLAERELFSFKCFRAISANAFTRLLKVEI